MSPMAFKIKKKNVSKAPRPLTRQLAIWKEGGEGNVLFNDAFSTFYLRFYGVKHMVKDHSDNERERKPAAATWATLSD